jgi:hypothetical protein
MYIKYIQHTYTYTYAIYIYIYIHICMHVCIYIHTYTHTHRHRHRHTHTHMCVCMHKVQGKVSASRRLFFLFPCFFLYIDSCYQLRLERAWECVFVCMCIHTDVCVYVCVCVYTPAPPRACEPFPCTCAPPVCIYDTYVFVCSVEPVYIL